MLRRSLSLLETGVIASWAPKKNFGFVAINGDADKTIFVHQSSIIQSRNQRPVQTIRRGVEIQFDIVKDDQGRESAKNVTSANGKTLSNRDEIPSTTVDIRALSNKLVDREDDSRHGSAIRGIVQSIASISKMQRRNEQLNRNIFRLINAIAEKDGLKEMQTGEELTATKKVVLANIIQEGIDRKAKREAGKGDADADDDEDDVEAAAPAAVEEEEKKSEKKEKKTAKKAAAAEEEFHSADDLLDLMEEGEEKKPKAKKGKKN